MQAKSHKGKLVTLAGRTSKEIKQFKQQKVVFFCPACNEQVIMKVGTKMIPHFAHRSVSHCPSYEGGEGGYHEQGKLLLYQWLSNQRLTVILEAYIPEINQRPDILLLLNEKQIAIEYQCARIPITQIQQRNAGYKKAGIIPIWILGANRFQRQTKHHIKIDQFITQFIHQFSPTFPQTLFFFCPHTLQFVTVQDLFLTKPGQAIGKIRATALKHFNFKEMFRRYPFTQQQVYQLWKKEKQQFRLKQRKRLYGSTLSWHQWLYIKGTHLEYLPSIIHLPVAAQSRMKTPTWDWQSRLCLELLAPLPIGGYVTRQICYQLLRNQIYNAHEYPLITSQAHPIEQYLQLLIHLQIIHQQSINTFEKINHIHFHENIEAALSGDDQIINQLLELKHNTSMFHR